MPKQYARTHMTHDTRTRLAHTALNCFLLTILIDCLGRRTYSLYLAYFYRLPFKFFQPTDRSIFMFSVISVPHLLT